MSGVEDMIHAAEQSLGLGEPNHIQDWYCERNGQGFNFNFPGATPRSPIGRGTQATRAP